MFDTFQQINRTNSRNINLQKKSILINIREWRMVSTFLDKKAFKRLKVQNYLKRLRKINLSWFRKQNNKRILRKKLYKNARINIRRGIVQSKTLTRNLNEILIWKKNLRKKVQIKQIITSNYQIKLRRKQKEYKPKYVNKTLIKKKYFEKNQEHWLNLLQKWMFLKKEKRTSFFKALRWTGMISLSYRLKYASSFRKYWPKKFKQHLNPNLKIKYFKLKKLRFKLFTKNLTSRINYRKKARKKEKWLEFAYWKNKKNKNPFNTPIYNKLSAFNPKTNKRIKFDFLQTLLGQYFLHAHLISSSLDGKRYYSREDFFRIMPKHLRTLTNHTREIRLRQKLGWFYTNLTRQKASNLRLLDTTKKNWPYSLFTLTWQLLRQSPWLESLESKRRLYTGFLKKMTKQTKWSQKFVWIPYLRSKKTINQKRNRLYKWRKSLLFKRNKQTPILKKKANRIKKILAKTILPFFGNLKERQFNSIQKKIQRKKAQTLSRDDLLLGKFEQRLDVMVYRLNWAPNIFWARRLIQEGFVFLTPKSDERWRDLHAPLKKYIYPLNLRDPKNLYKKTKWNPLKNYAKMNFLQEPLRKIHFRVQPGDIIQCAPSALLHKFKTTSNLWKKPIPKHFLSLSSLTETQQNWQRKKSKLTSRATSENNQTLFATLLFNPSYKNLLKTDRLNSRFIRWIAL